MTTTTRRGLLSAGIIVGVLAAVGARNGCRPAEPNPAGSEPTGATAEPMTAKTVDIPAVRGRVWEKARGRVVEANRASAAALDARLDEVHRFLADRGRRGGRPFATQLLSLEGKWELVRNRLLDAGQDRYAAWIQGEFEKHLFTADDLSKVVAAAVTGYLADLEAIENQLAVAVYQDLEWELEGSALSPAEVMPGLAATGALRGRVAALTAGLIDVVERDVRAAAGQTVASLVVGEIATGVVIRIGSAIAARVGVSAGILGTGAASGLVTFGIGLVVAYVVDSLLDYLLKLSGYDPEGQIAGRVGEALSSLGSLIADGDPEARAAVAKLEALSRTDPDKDVRRHAAQAVTTIRKNRTRLYGLRGELGRLRTAHTLSLAVTLRRAVTDHAGEPAAAPTDLHSPQPEKP